MNGTTPTPASEGTEVPEIILIPDIDKGQYLALTNVRFVKYVNMLAYKLMSERHKPKERVKTLKNVSEPKMDQRESC